MFRRFLILGVFFAVVLAGMRAEPASAGRCSLSNHTIAALKSGFEQSLGSGNGGFFVPNMMWGAVVDRDGDVCAVFKSGDAWPGSRAIAIAKAETANDFSNYKISLSTANLYGLVLPTGSLFGLNNSNPYNPLANDPRVPLDRIPTPGGIITFGGGVALYSGGQVVGGFGVSGDTSCADHAVAYKARTAAIRGRALSKPPTNDNISYAGPGALANTFNHPHCKPGDIVPPTI